MIFSTGKTASVIFITVLFHVFSEASAQSGEPSLLKVGDKPPALSVFKWLRGKPFVDFKKNTIYVVEFGATWCTPCARAIPELSDIQKKYKGQVEVISLFVQEANMESKANDDPQYVKNVSDFIKKRENSISYTVGVDDPTHSLENNWLKKAKLSGIPQVFVIDRNGFVGYIGGSMDEVREAVENLMKKEYKLETIVEKNDSLQKLVIKYDHDKLLLIENNGGNETDFLFRSMLTKYDGKINAYFLDFLFSFQPFKPDSIFDKDEDKFEVIGNSVGQLYYFAYGDTLWNYPEHRTYQREWPDTVQNPHWKNSYGKYWHKLILETSDKEIFDYDLKHTRNRFNYSLKVPSGTGTARFMQFIMRNDLMNYFGFDVSVETRDMPYWKLTAPNKAFAVSKLASKDQSLKYNVTGSESPLQITNAEMKDIIVWLGGNFGFGSCDYGKVPLDQQAAFIDETGISEEVDFIWDGTLSFNEAKKYLKSVGLELSRGYRPMKVVVVRDSKNSFFD